MRPRLIPVLLIDRDRRLVKTVGFGERTYVGDPFNVIKLFNEKEVDELCLLDIDATTDGRDPDFGFIAELASECFMPLSYGGGIASLAAAERLNRAGAEKLVLGTHSFDLSLVQAIARDLGSQAVVGCVDVRHTESGPRAFIRRGTQATDLMVIDACRKLQEAGVGEIILQSIDRDGTRSGYDLKLLNEIAPAVSVPVIALGGAGDVEHLMAALASGASAAASGSAFCFIGRLRAVLVSYPGERDLARATGRTT